MERTGLTCVQPELSRHTLLTHTRACAVGGRLTDEELRSIVGAIGYTDPGYLGRGHWMTCPNNHPYVIGDCGGPRQGATCPECGAQIGGENYRLAGGNRQATDLLRRAGVDPTY